MRPLLLVLALVSAAACGSPDAFEEESLEPEEIGDPEKADTVGGVTVEVLGGLTLEDSMAVALPVPTRFVGFVVLAPAGADLQVTAAGGALATRVTLYGPRTAGGLWGRSIATGVGSVRKVVGAAGQYLALPQPRYVGRSGSATVSVACFGTRCLGSCSTAAPKLSRRGWIHSNLSPMTISNGTQGHRALDTVVGQGIAPLLNAKFTYGTVDKDLEDEDVDLWVRSCPGWVKVATKRTDDDGRVAAQLAVFPPGDYRYLWHVPGDGTVAEGRFSVWEPGRQVVVSDIDGTLTTNDSQLFKFILSGEDPAQFKDSEKVLWTVRRLGYRVLYVSGRPEILIKHSKGWVTKHGFPPGPVKVTDSTMEVLPTESGVGTFKTDYLQGLRTNAGVTLFAGYGNATTDISAYQANAIANERLFIIGPHAGERGTTGIPSYTAHLPASTRLPFAARP